MMRKLGLLLLVGFSANAYAANDTFSLGSLPHQEVHIKLNEDMPQAPELPSNPLLFSSTTSLATLIDTLHKMENLTATAAQVKECLLESTGSSPESASDIQNDRAVNLKRLLDYCSALISVYPVDEKGEPDYDTRYYGNRWAKESGKSILWGELDGEADHGMIPLERWIDGDPQKIPGTLLAWIDEQRLYLHQIDSVDLDESMVIEACRVVNVITKEITTPKACVKGGMAKFDNIYFSDGVAIITRSGPCHFDLDILRWTPETGLGEQVMPDLDLYPDGDAVPYFTEAGLAILTNCHLGEERPCAGDFADENHDKPWRHYVVKDSAFVLLREGLPREARPHPTEADRYLWREDDHVCEGNPTGKHRCW